MKPATLPDILYYLTPQFTFTTQISTTKCTIEYILILFLGMGYQQPGLGYHQQPAAPAIAVPSVDASRSAPSGWNDPPPVHGKVCI